MPTHHTYLYKPWAGCKKALNSIKLAAKCGWVTPQPLGFIAKKSQSLIHLKQVNCIIHALAGRFLVTTITIK
ncbi:MAG: hypothetical protein ACJA0N_002130 [Pseudohongiellaceae bacterium]|jgi:hypothetical protein